MYSLATLLLACLATAALTAVIAGFRGRRQVRAAQDAERQRYEALLQEKEAEVRGLMDAQASLARDIADLQARGRRPLRTLVDSLLG